MNNNVEEITYLNGGNGVTEKIKKAMYDAAKQFVYIGFLLWEVQEYGYYTENGYADVYEYAEKELNFKRSSTKNFIAVAKTFGWHKGDCSGDYTGVTMTINQDYKNFSYSQLVEMLSMSEKQRQLVSSDMTVKEIRQLKKDNSNSDIDFKALDKIIEKTKETQNQDAGQMSGQAETAAVTINNYWVDIPKELLLEFIKYVPDLRKTKSLCYDITIKKHEN